MTRSHRRHPVAAAVIAAGLAAVALVHAFHRTGGLVGNPGPVSALSSSASVANDAHCFTAAQAWNEIGVTGCVVFTVGYADVSAAGNVFLDQFSNYSSGFSVWIPAGEPFSVNAANQFAHRTIRVSGTISSYEGAPQIEVLDSNQITLNR